MTDVIERIRKDLTEEFNNSITESLYNIRNIKIKCHSDPRAINALNFELHELFLKLRAKIKNIDDTNKTQLLTEQEKIHLFYNKFKGKAFKISTIANEYGELEKKVQINYQVLAFLNKLLEDREIKLREVLEMLGLTATTSKKSKRLV